MKQKKVDILGITYTIKINVEENDDIRIKGVSGITDASIKEILIEKFKIYQDCLKDLDYFRRKTLRHEIIHAFLYESGLSVNSSDVNQWATNEEMVDWIAIQYPKIQKVFKKLGIEE